MGSATQNRIDHLTRLLGYPPDPWLSFDDARAMISRIKEQRLKPRPAE
jgi:hypothetical protein